MIIGSKEVQAWQPHLSLAVLLSYGKHSLKTERLSQVRPSSKHFSSTAPWILPDSIDHLKQGSHPTTSPDSVGSTLETPLLFLARPPMQGMVREDRSAKVKKIGSISRFRTLPRARRRDSR